MTSNSGSEGNSIKELRIVMVGKTGIGKSATGNTILGRQCFESKLSATSMTVYCSKGRGKVDGQQVAVIDTPGLFDTRFDKDKTNKDLAECIKYASPGPHVFLVVIRVGRFTEEEKQTVEKIQEIFGQAADRYSMVLFTGGDLLEDITIEEFLGGSPDLKELVSRCNDQYHVFNNKLKDGTQVTELLQKIINTVQKNGGSHYTNDMFQEAERAIEEEKQRILKEKEEEIRREQEELERKVQEKYDKEIEKMKKELQDELERQRKEREEERKREREEMKEERKMEREEMREDMKREREEMKEERKMEREEMREDRKRDREREEGERRIRELREMSERELERQKARLREDYIMSARHQAEKSSLCTIQ